MIRSILKNNKRLDLHFVLLTDPKSVPYLDKILKKFIKKDIIKSTVSFLFLSYMFHVTGVGSKLFLVSNNS